jgi:cytochrome c peroxidase
MRNVLKEALSVLVLASLVALLNACTSKENSATQTSVQRLSDADLLAYAYEQAPKRQHSEIVPIPEKLPLLEKEVALGQKLFFDPRLSADNSIACATCHQFNHAGADPRPVSLGIKGQAGELNSLPVFNSVFNFKQFWDGHAKDLIDQVRFPLTNPVEMGQPSMQAVVDKLQTLPEYPKLFNETYPAEGLTADTLAYSIAQFERSLLTPNSAFDRFLKGEKDALTPQALQGYQLFKQMGCIACHNGINIGGNLFQKAGIFNPLTATGADSQKWLGRYNVTHNPQDKFFIKVPSLRNVALTAPYLHDGSINTLSKVIRFMAKNQLGTDISETDNQAIEAFLHSLTGQQPSISLMDATHE